MSRFVVATPDHAFEERVRDALGLRNGELRRLQDDPMQLEPSHAVRAVLGPDGHDTDVVVFGPGVPVAAALELAALFDLERPEVSTILVAPPTPKLWQQAMRAGIRDVVPEDADAEALRDSLDRAHQTASRRRQNLVHKPEDLSGAGRFISVVSPKGGSGKTTVSTNLAAGLAERAPGEVVLVDLDLQFGDVAAALRLVPDYTAADAAAAAERHDAMALKSLLTPFQDRLFALCAPDSPEQGELITTTQCSAMLKLLADEFRYVVVDTSAGITEPTLAALELASDIVFVCTMDVSSVRNLRKEVQALQQLGMTHPRPHFVLNRSGSRVGLVQADIERSVGLPIAVEVPSSRAVPLSMNQGAPVIESDPRSAVARQMNTLVERFAEAPVRPGLFGRRRTP